MSDKRHVQASQTASGTSRHVRSSGHSDKLHVQAMSDSSQEPIDMPVRQLSRLWTEESLLPLLGMAPSRPMQVMTSRMASRTPFSYPATGCRSRSKELQAWALKQSLRLSAATQRMWHGHLGRAAKPSLAVQPGPVRPPLGTMRALFTVQASLMTLRTPQGASKAKVSVLLLQPVSNIACLRLV